MTSAQQSSIRLFGAYCGLGYMAMLLLGWGLFAGFLPPTPPSLGPKEIAALFADPTMIRIGMVMVMFAALIFMFFAGAITHYLARIEGGAGALTYTAVLGAAGNMVLTFYPAVWWLTAAYRPDRSIDVIYGLNDMAWLQFIGGVSMFDALPLAVGIAALCDHSPQAPFPRWAGFANFMTVLLIMPDQLLFFFHRGPFAWNGLFGIWLPLAVFGSWFVMMFVVLRRAILRERDAAGSTPPGHTAGGRVAAVH